jgi:phosphate transport system permease protein
MMDPRARRRLRSRIMVALVGLTVLLALLPLALILASLVLRGAQALSPSFFVNRSAPVGETGGGVAHAILGTLIIVGTAALVAVPLGVGAGLYASEYRGTSMARTTRFVADVLNGTPSIVVGLLAWTWVVAVQGHFSAAAGSFALAIIMVPMVMRTTEELVALVPNELREAALALGYPRWRTTLVVVLRTAMPGLVTGVLLAVARVAGETAPLLFTALGSEYFSLNLDRPMAALPLVVYKYATGPYPEWHQLAWTAALVLILVVCLLGVSARLATRQRLDAKR